MILQESIKAAQSGDALAWSRLYHHHYPWLYALALQMCGNTPDAKDAVQETFIQAYVKLSQLKDPAAFAGWLKTILLRRCYRFRQDRFGNRSMHSVPLADNVWEDDVDQQLEACTQEIKIYETLARFSETLRSVLLLRYFSNWQSYEQMAQILGVPVGTIRSRLNEARTRWADHWTKHEGDNERAAREAGAWNHFYESHFKSIHVSLDSREKFLQHVDKNVQFIVTSGKIVHGRQMIEQEIEDDLRYGSGFADMRVTSSGSMSIVEVANTNSPEYPDRCPESSVFVLYRTQDKVTRLNLHNSH